MLTAQYRGGSIAFFPLDAEGNLGPAVIHEHHGPSKKIARRQSTAHPHWTGFSPDGKFAFVPDLGTDQIHSYKVRQDFSGITNHFISKTIPGGGPRHMRFSVNGRFIYLLNEMALSISTFSYDPRLGQTKRVALTPILPASIKAKEVFNSAAEIVVHPNGKWLYTSNRGHDSISVFEIEPKSGQLNHLESEAIRGAWPRNINIDPSFQWILAGGQHSSTVSVFKIDPKSGQLSFRPKNIIHVPAPSCILFAPR